MLLGHEVTVLDNFFTGSRTTVSHWIGHPNFEMVRHDVTEPFMIEVDRECANPRCLRLVLMRGLTRNRYKLTSLFVYIAVVIRNLPPRLSRFSSSLPIQPRQDHKDFLHGNSQYARSR